MFEELLKELKALNAELQRVTAVSEKLANLRADAIETVKTTATAEAPKTTKTTKAAASTKTEEAPKIEEPAAETVAPPPKMTVEEMQSIVDGTVTATDDMMRAMGATFVLFGGTKEAPVPGDVRKERMAKVKSLLDNPKVGAASLAETKPNVRKAVAKKIIEWIAELAPAASEESDDIDL